MEDRSVKNQSSYIIIGTGGFAIELASLIKDLGLTLQGFVGPENTTAMEGQWLGDDDCLVDIDQKENLIIAIGDPSKRQEIANKIGKINLSLSTFIHSNSYISRSSSIGIGTMIYPNSSIHASVKLGEGVLINSNVTIGHETTIDSFVNVGPGASIGGRCKLGKRVYIGIGSSIIENISIIDDAYIGAGAVINKDITEKGTYVGVPAKKI